MTPASDLDRLSRALGRLLGRDAAALHESFVAATVADLPGLLRLRASVLGPEMTWDDEAFLRWRYFGAGGPGAPANVLWVLHDNAGQPQSCLGVEPQALHVGTDMVAAGRFMDVMVEPKIKSLGVGAWMNLVLQQKHEVSLAVGATKDSYNLIRRVFSPLPDRHSWKLLVRSEDFLKRNTPRLARIPGVSVLADAALGVGRYALARGYGLGLEVAPLSNLNGLETAVAELDQSMAAVGWTFSQRTAAYLSWRYLRNTRRHYQLWGAHRQGRLVGLLVTRMVAGRGELVDWLWDARAAEPGRSQIITALFARAAEDLARQGATTVWTRTLGAPGEEAAVRLVMRRRKERDTVAINTSSPGRLAALTSARWFLS
ncbi:MAG TPA: hypothetical protein VGG33_00235, partial [Polyangia bacterium]